MAAAQETRGFLDKVYTGSLSLMVNSTVRQKRVSREDLAELYDILQAGRGGNAKPGTDGRE